MRRVHGFLNFNYENADVDMRSYETYNVNGAPKLLCQTTLYSNAAPSLKLIRSDKMWWYQILERWACLDWGIHLRSVELKSPSLTMEDSIQSLYADRLILSISHIISCCYWVNPDPFPMLGASTEWWMTTVIYVKRLTQPIIYTF